MAAPRKTFRTRFAKGLREDKQRSLRQSAVCARAADTWYILLRTVRFVRVVVVSNNSHCLLRKTKFCR
eukprot:1973355-Pyramimonas_sp.AAC.1